QVAGISGDMFLSALVDCGASKNKIINNIKMIEKLYADTRIKKMEFINSESNGIRATRFLFEIEEKILERKATEMLRILANCCDVTSLSEMAKKFVMETMKTIIRVESRIHDKEVKDLHLHESSSIDTAADLIGSATALDDLNLFFDTTFYSAKVAVGGGTTQFSHGTIPNPTNAVLEIFRILEIPIAGGPVHSEMTTPTGAAILAGLNPKIISTYPEFIPHKIGYGTGYKKFYGVPNILRISIGKSNINYSIQSDTVSVLETNIDDMTGEMIGDLVEKLSKQDVRVKDVTLVSGITKKNRPVHILKVICSEDVEKKIIELIFNETGTLGIRKTINERYKLERFSVLLPIMIENHEFVINVKISKDQHGKIINIKPEYDNIKEIANQLGFSFKKTMETVNNLIFQRNL
ncbi:MAG: nickel pincer cofactor biosynthesis protein LarC, partial [Candidatus Nitrosocosmicus sp.]|nr:nickel pincer cofactor biosynthesis protein LarC [Candidatus Nitrosocosmicus sp.]